MFGELQDLRDLVSTIGGRIDTGPSAQTFLTSERAEGSFILNPDDTFVIQLRPSPTVREVGHEFGHAVTFRALGPDAYRNLAEPLREYLAIQYNLHQHFNTQRIGELSVTGFGVENERLLEIGINQIDDLDQFIAGPTRPQIRREVVSLLSTWGIEL